MRLPALLLLAALLGRRSRRLGLSTSQLVCNLQMVTRVLFFNLQFLLRFLFLFWQIEIRAEVPHRVTEAAAVLLSPRLNLVDHARLLKAIEES